MKVMCYYSDGNAHEVTHYNPKLRGVKINGLRPVAITIEASTEEMLTDDFAYLLGTVEFKVHPGRGFVGVETLP